MKKRILQLDISIFKASTSTGWNDGDSSQGPSAVVKEELVEVKEEPLDETDDLVKQEEPETEVSIALE